MAENTSSRDADLRARMRSQVRGREYLGTRRLYAQNTRPRPGQDFVSQAKKPALVAPKKPQPLPIIYPMAKQEPQKPVWVPRETPQYDSGYASRVSAFAPAVAVSEQPPAPALVTAKEPRKSFRLHFAFLQNRLLTSMAVVIFLAGVVVALNGVLTNRHITAQVQAMSSRNAAGGDDSSSAPSTDKPTGPAVQNYSVAPNLPRYITIDKLNVFARVMSMSVNAKNQLQAPGNVYDAGWYSSSSQPGNAGAMLVDGHISSWTTKGVFYGISKLVPGDTIQITRGDGTKFTYAVKSVTAVPEDQVNMASLLVSADPSKPGLNLISCFGDVIPGTNEFDKRVIVNAVME